MKYTGLYLTLKPDTSDPDMARDILVSELAEAGFESFSETENGLEAFIQTEQYDAENLPHELLAEYSSAWHTADIESEASALFITAGLGTEHRPR